MERILIIEDHRSVQNALKRLFESENYVWFKSPPMATQYQE